MIDALISATPVRATAAGPTGARRPRPGGRRARGRSSSWAGSATATAIGSTPLGPGRGGRRRSPRARARPPRPAPSSSRARAHRGAERRARAGERLRPGLGGLGRRERRVLELGRQLADGDVDDHAADPVVHGEEAHDPVAPDARLGRRLAREVDLRPGLPVSSTLPQRGLDLDAELAQQLRRRAADVLGRRDPVDLRQPGVERAVAQLRVPVALAHGGLVEQGSEHGFVPHGREVRLAAMAQRLITATGSVPPSLARVDEPSRAPFRVGLVQERWHEDPAEHEAALAEGIATAAGEGATLVCLQELTSPRTSPSRPTRSSRPGDGRADPRRPDDALRRPLRDRARHPRPRLALRARGGRRAGLQHGDRGRRRPATSSRARASSTSRSPPPARARRA